MKTTILDLKKNLLNEFEWLKSEHPILSFKEIEFKIYNYKDYNKLFGEEHQDTYEDKEFSAFIMENLSDDNVEYAIFMILSDSFEPDDTDRAIILNNNIEESHLFYWVLYHEYGHLLQMDLIFKEQGLIGLENEKYNNDEALESLWNLEKSGKITREELEVLYRDLSFEKKADEYANTIYRIRKKTLPCMNNKV